MPSLKDLSSLPSEDFAGFGKAMHYDRRERGFDEVEAKLSSFFNDPKVVFETGNFDLPEPVALSLAEPEPTPSKPDVFPFMGQGVKSTPKAVINSGSGSGLDAAACQSLRSLIQGLAHTVRIENFKATLYDAEGDWLVKDIPYPSLLSGTWLVPKDFIRVQNGQFSLDSSKLDISKMVFSSFTISSLNGVSSISWGTPVVNSQPQPVQLSASINAQPHQISDSNVKVTPAADSFSPAQAHGTSTPWGHFDWQI